MSPKIGTSNLQTINGAIVGMDAGGRQEVSIYGTNAVPGDEAVNASAAGRMAVNMGGGMAPGDGFAALGLLTPTDAGDVARNPAAMSYLFNGMLWDRARNNHILTLLPSAVRAVTTASANQVNYNGRGVLIFFDITVVPGATTVTLTIDTYDSIGGTWKLLLTGAAEVGVVDRCYLLYPGAGVAANGIDVVNAFPLPRTWRINVTHSGAGNFTYSVFGTVVL